LNATTSINSVKSQNESMIRSYRVKDFDPLQSIISLKKWM